MTEVIDRPVMCFEPTAALTRDENGSPVVSVQVYFDDPEDTHARTPEVIRIYLEPVDSKRLGLLLQQPSGSGFLPSRFSPAISLTRCPAGISRKFLEEPKP